MGMKSGDIDLIEAHLSRQEVSKAFEILSQYPDLQFKDIPALRKQLLEGIAGDPEAVRQCVLGAASESAAIRQFCKKFLPKLGAAAAPDLLLLAVESHYPLRKAGEWGEPFLGSFDGFPSPVGKVITEKRMSMTIKEPAVYSQADKYAKEVGHLLAAALEKIKPEYLLIVHECQLVFGIREKKNSQLRSSQKIRTQDPQTFTTPVPIHVAGLPKDLLAKAVHAWAKGEPFLSNEHWAGDETARRIRHRMDSHLKQADDANRVVFLSNAVSYVQSLAPDEALRILLETEKRLNSQQVDGETKSRLQNLIAWQKKDVKKREDHEAVPVVSGSTDSQQVHQPAISGAIKFQTPPKEGGEVDNAHRLLSNLAGYFGIVSSGIPAVKDELDDNDLPEIRATPNPGDRELIGELRQFIKSFRKTGCIPDAALAQAPWQSRLLDLLKRAARPYINQLEAARAKGPINKTDSNTGNATKFYFEVNESLLDLYECACVLLAEPQLNEWGDFWNECVKLGWNDTYYDSIEYLPELIINRCVLPLKMLDPFFLQPTEWSVQNQVWVNMAAPLYARDDERAKQAVRDAISNIPLPAEVMKFNRFKDSDPPYLWIISTAWQRKDIALLAAAFERCAMPFFWRGDRAMLPVTETCVIKDRYHAAQTPESKNAIAIADIWAAIRERFPNRIQTIIRNAIGTIEYADLSLALLPMAAKTGDLDKTHGSNIFPLFESSQPNVVQAALEAISICPAIIELQLNETLSAIERCLASTSSGVVNAATAALGNMAVAYPGHSDEAARLLAEALFFEAETVQEQAMKGLKKAKKKISGKQASQLKRLAEKNPRRFKKLVEELV